MFGGQSREVVRIRVKKCDGMVQPEYKKLCVDPELTSFEILQHLLAKAFNIRGDFTISYLGKDVRGRDAYLSLLSDWDLDAAFLSASDPVLKLKVDLKPFEEGLEDWDVIAPVDVPQRRLASLVDKNSILGQLTEHITTHVGKTVSQVSKAIGFKGEDDGAYRPSKPPMSDSEFHHFLDGVGNLIRPQEFRLSVYQGGLEPSLRRVAWRHLMNIYPPTMTGKERFDYLRQKSAEYYQLRDAWREQFSQGNGTEELKFVTNMVKKDVLRTDRTLKFYAGGDDNKNILALFNILVTYALTHPAVSYCQGMSDIASPILVIEKDEAHAYICFCGAMKRNRPNFSLDGETMTTKFKHLSLLLQHHDPDFYAYLKRRDADDLFFCYRWLLLELKREFPFEDALYMLEVMWSSLPPDPPERGIELTDESFSLDALLNPPASPTLSSTAYMRLKHLYRPAATPQVENTTEQQTPPLIENKENGCVAHSDDMEQAAVTPEKKNAVHFDSGPVTPVDEEKAFNPKEFLDIQDSMTKALLDRSSSIDRSLENGAAVTTDHVQELDTVSEEIQKTNQAESHDKGSGDPQVNSVNNTVAELRIDGDKRDTSQAEPKICTTKRPTAIPLGRQMVVDHPLAKASPKVEEVTSALVMGENGITEQTMNVSTCEEAAEGNPSIDFVKVNEKPPKLPPPQEFGCGNPFLLFLCLTLLLQHRDHIIRHRMDYNDLAMHFDKMVRRHNVHRVLHMAKQMFAEYLKAQSQVSNESSESDDISV